MSSVHSSDFLDGRFASQKFNRKQTLVLALDLKNLTLLNE